MSAVLSQGAIELTFKLLKPSHPSLALQVRNLLEGKRDIKEAYRIDLPQDEILRIAQILSIEVSRIKNPGMMIVAKALVEDWQSFIN